MAANYHRWLVQLVPFLFVFIVVLGKKKPREKKGLIRQGNTLFVHAHYRGFSFNWQHEALNVSDAPVERQERASMLFVFPENVTGAGIVVALTRGFGRAITIARLTSPPTAKPCSAVTSAPS